MSLSIMSTPKNNAVQFLALVLASIILVGNVVECLAQPVTISEQAANQFGLQVQNAVKTGDVNAFNALVDWNFIVTKATTEFEQYVGLQKVLKEFRGGMIQGVTSVKQGMAVNIINATRKSGDYKLLRIHNKNGNTYALFRMIVGTGGVNYHDMLLGKSADGTIKAQDIFIALSGELVSETLNRSSLPFIQKVQIQNEGELSDKEKIILKETDVYVTFMGSIKEPEKLLTLYETLPERLKITKHTLLLRMAAANKLQKRELAVTTAEEFRKHYPNSPTIDLLMVDVHVFNKDIEGALKAIDGVERQVGYDPHLDNLRSEIYYKKEDFKLALEFAERSVKNDPTVVNSYWTVLGISLKTKNYSLTAKYLTLVEEKLKIPLADLKKVPEYAGFVESLQYAAWEKSRKKVAP